MKADFTTEWLNAWNSHDLEEIIGHYSENIDFSSPVIQEMGIDAAGRITQKDELRAYFKRALEKYPDLHFELYHELKGVNSIVLSYKSVRNSLSAEYMELDTAGKIIKVRAHYQQYEDLIHFVDEWLKSWTSHGRSGQEDILLSYYTDDCFYADPATRTGVQGVDNLKSYFRQLLKYNPEWEWKRTELIPTANGCTLKWEARIPVGASEVVVAGLDILELTGGKISRNEVFFDRHEWMKLIGKK